MKIRTLSIILIIICFQPLMSIDFKLVMTNGETNSVKLSEIDSILLVRTDTFPLVDYPKEVQFNIIDCDLDLGHASITIKSLKTEVLTLGNFSLSNQEEFYFKDGINAPIQLLPDEEFIVDIVFKAEVAGVFNCELEFSVDSTKVHTIDLSAEKQSLDFDIDSTFLDLGTLCPGILSTFQISLENTGVGKNIITYNKTNNLLIEEEEIEIDQGAEYNLSITISTKTNIGTQVEEISFTDKCGKSINIRIICNTDMPSISAGNVLIQSEYPTPKEETIELTNTGTFDVEVTGYSTNDEFTVVEPEFPFTIPVGGSVNAKIRFSPKSTMKVDSEIKFICECNYDFRLPITGTLLVYLVTEDFESYSPNTYPSSGGWNLQQVQDFSHMTYVSDEFSVSGNNSLQTYGHVGGDTNTTTVSNIVLDYIPDILYTETYVRIDQIGLAGIGIGLGGDDMNFMAYVCLSNHHHFFYGSGVNDSYQWDNDGYTPMVWYKIKTKIDLINSTMSIWLDDKLVADNTKVAHIVKPENLAYMLVGGGGHPGDCITWFDDVKVWYESK